LPAPTLRSRKSLVAKSYKMNWGWIGTILARGTMMRLWEGG